MHDGHAALYCAADETLVLRRTCSSPGYEVVMVVPLGGYEAADRCGRQAAAVISAAVETVAVVLCLLVACQRMPLFARNPGD